MTIRKNTPTGKEIALSLRMGKASAIAQSLMGTRPPAPEIFGSSLLHMGKFGRYSPGAPKRNSEEPNFLTEGIKKHQPAMTLHPGPFRGAFHGRFRSLFFLLVLSFSFLILLILVVIQILTIFQCMECS